jgi:hypothetical protein
MRKAKYIGKLIYATPGSGKTTIVNSSVGFYDADELMVEVMQEFQPEFIRIENEPIQTFIKRFTDTFKYKSKVNNQVIKRIQYLLDDKLTVLTGTIKIAKYADFVYLSPINFCGLLERHQTKDLVEFAREEEIRFLNKNKIPFTLLSKDLSQELLNTKPKK